MACVVVMLTTEVVNATVVAAHTHLAAAAVLCCVDPAHPPLKLALTVRVLCQLCWTPLMRTAHTHPGCCLLSCTV